MAIQVAETSKAKSTKKALSHLELHRKLDGGHIVRHVYHGFGHEPEDHHFNAEGRAEGRGKGGQHILKHLQKHGGLPGLADYDKREESETEDEIEA